MGGKLIEIESNRVSWGPPLFRTEHLRPIPPPPFLSWWYRFLISGRRRLLLTVPSRATLSLIFRSYSYMGLLRSGLSLFCPHRRSLSSYLPSSLLCPSSSSFLFFFGPCSLPPSLFCQVPPPSSLSPLPLSSSSSSVRLVDRPTAEGKEPPRKTEPFSFWCWLLCPRDRNITAERPSPPLWFGRRKGARRSFCSPRSVPLCALSEKQEAAFIVQRRRVSVLKKKSDASQISPKEDRRTRRRSQDILYFENSELEKAVEGTI